jgi:hypothetical protein
MKGATSPVGTTNPYLDVLNVEAAKRTLDAELYTSRTILPDSLIGNWKNVVEIDANRDLISSQIIRLHERGVTVFIPQLHMGVSGEDIEHWADSILHGELAVEVEQTRRLQRDMFLVILAHSEDREKLLRSTPIHFGKHLVMLSPWESQQALEELKKF